MNLHKLHTKCVQMVTFTQICVQLFINVLHTDLCENGKFTHFCVHPSELRTDIYLIKTNLTLLNHLLFISIILAFHVFSLGIIPLYHKNMTSDPTMSHDMGTLCIKYIASCYSKTIVIRTYNYIWCLINRAVSQNYQKHTS